MKNRSAEHACGVRSGVGPRLGEPLSRLLAAILACRDESYALWDHSIRVAATARRLAAATGATGETRRLAYLGGLLHDVGKTEICQRTLFKPGPLSTAERGIMNLHPEIGARLVRELGVPEVSDAVLLHHELCDGTGYPFGIDARDLPQIARIVAVADYYEALCESRPYRPIPCDRVEALGRVGELARKGKLDRAICRRLPRVVRPKRADPSRDFDLAARFFDLRVSLARSSTGR
jgi:putative nucleotidyltransferase with HDIG domain